MFKNSLHYIVSIETNIASSYCSYITNTSTSLIKLTIKMCVPAGEEGSQPPRSLLCPGPPMLLRRP